MTSRGHIIGRIIDDLSNLTEKIEFRANLGLFDIHRILENFIRDVLKVIYDANDINNLNATRANAPGLDLGSDLLKTGYQISSKVDSPKINSSFLKIADAYPDKFDLIKFIVIGKKQKTYPAFEPANVPSNIKFDLSKDIIDFGDLSKLIFDLSIDKLIALNEIFEKEFLIVRHHIVEPNMDMDRPIELFKKNEFQSAKNGLKLFDGQNDADALEKINTEGRQLSNLPLRTRLILKYIIEKGKEESSTIDDRFECRYYLIPKLKREINLPNKEIEEEINTMIDERFLGIEQMELDTDIHVPEAAVYTNFSEWFKYLITYAIEEKLLNDIIINLDLTVIDKNKD